MLFETDIQCWRHPVLNYKPLCDANDLCPDSNFNKYYMLLYFAFTGKDISCLMINVIVDCGCCSKSSIQQIDIDEVRRLDKLMADLRVPMECEWYSLTFVGD